MAPLAKHQKIAQNPTNLHFCHTMEVAKHKIDVTTIAMIHFYNLICFFKIRTCEETWILTHGLIATTVTFPTNSSHQWSLMDYHTPHQDWISAQVPESGGKVYYSLLWLLGPMKSLLWCLYWPNDRSLSHAIILELPLQFGSHTSACGGRCLGPSTQVHMHRKLLPSDGWPPTMTLPSSSDSRGFKAISLSIKCRSYCEISTVLVCLLK